MLRVIWQPLLKPYRSISPKTLASWRMFSSEMTTPPERFNSIQIFLNNFTTFFSWSYEEMPGIDPKIVEHEITTYPDAKPISAEASSS
jgi:hypothetical protein